MSDDEGFEKETARRDFHRGGWREIAFVVGVIGGLIVIVVVL